jgi:hypothetical protein
MSFNDLFCTKGTSRANGCSSSCPGKKNSTDYNSNDTCTARTDMIVQEGNCWNTWSTVVKSTNDLNKKKSWR